MPEDVIPAESSAAVTPPTTEVGPAPEPVSSDQGDSRPVENLAAEFHRKMAKLQSQYDTLVQYVASQAQSRPAAPSKGEPTDDELWSLIQQGDRGAYELYTRRIAAQTSQVQGRQMEQEQLVGSQLGILMGRYPMLNDASHPLTQQATSTYQALLARGYPATRATMLDAVKTAIADRPDLVAELHAKTQPSTLRRQRDQAGVTGATTREEPVNPSKSKPISKEEQALAKRMGLKRTPEEAIKRFHERQERGESALGAVASYVKEE